MSIRYLGEIRVFGFNFPPKGWAECNGQLMQISQNQALFSLLGTTWGGNGQTTFALPDLRGRVPIHVGGGHTLGERGGEEAHTLTAAETPAHLHGVNAVSAATGGNSVPTGRFLGGANNMYHAPSSLTPITPDTVTTTGGGQPHANQQPYLTLNICIALQGVFPSQT